MFIGQKMVQYWQFHVVQSNVSNGSYFLPSVHPQCLHLVRAIHPSDEADQAFSKNAKQSQLSGENQERWRDRQDVTDLLSSETLFEIKWKPEIRAEVKKATAWGIR